MCSLQSEVVIQSAPESFSQTDYTFIEVTETPTMKRELLSLSVVISTDVRL